MGTSSPPFLPAQEDYILTIEHIHLPNKSSFLLFIQDKSCSARHRLLMHVTSLGQFLDLSCTQPALALNPKARCDLPASPRVSGLFLQAQEIPEEREMRIHKEQESIPSPANYDFPFLEGEGRSLQVNHKPRTSPKLMQRRLAPAFPSQSH